MFDNVGKNNDEEATKRSLASLLITTLMLGAGAAFFVGYGAMKVVETVQTIQESEELVEVFIEDDGMDEAPPPPPPPPPPPAAADADEEEEEEDEEPTNETEEMVDEVEELKEEVKTEIKSVARPKGEKDGVEGGVEGGVVGGIKDGVKDGVVGGELNGGIRVFHHRDLEVKSRRVPRYPKEAETLNLGDQRCKIQVKIDEKGVPFEAKVSGCPEVFHGPARESILKWRWYPPKAGKQKVKAQTLIAVLFKAR